MMGTKKAEWPGRGHMGQGGLGQGTRGPALEAESEHRAYDSENALFFPYIQYHHKEGV